MIKACIDIGTNSVKLLVAAVRDQRVLEILRYRSETTRIGQGVDKTHRLLPEAIDRTLSVIDILKQEAEQLWASEIIPVATSAVRDARNRDEFIQKAMAQTGLKPLVISGAEEARLTFVGVCSDSPNLLMKKLILVDVGGGSSDFVVAQRSEIEDKFSVNVGFIRLTEAFIHSDPVNSDELQGAMEHVKAILNDHLSNISMDGRHLIGVGGTINILARIIYQKIATFLPEGIKLRTLQQKEVAGMLRYLGRMSLEDRKQVPGLPPERADIMVAGVAIFTAIMDILNAEKIIVSDKGMRHGVLIDDGAILE